MAATEKKLKKCKNGHSFYKSSDCPTCPVCEAERKTETDFFSVLAAPARRALENNGINTREALSGYSEKEIMTFHGMGKSSIPKLREILKQAGMKFKK